MIRLLMTLFLALAMVACGNDGADAEKADATVEVTRADSPDAALMKSVVALQNGDIVALAKNTMPPGKFDELKAEWNEQRTEEASAEEKAQFQQQMQMLTAPDAEEQLMAMLEPQLDQFGPQLPMFVAMFKSMGQNAVQENDDLDDEQQEQAVQVLNAVGNWASTAELASKEKAQQSINTLVASARALELESIEDVRALEFEQLLAKAGVMYNAMVQIFDIYGISIDDTLSSVTTKTLSEDDDSAMVQVNFDFLGSSQSVEAEMVKVDGLWYSADTLETMEEAAEEAAEADVDDELLDEMDDTMEEAIEEDDMEPVPAG